MKLCKSFTSLNNTFKFYHLRFFRCFVFSSYLSSFPLTRTFMDFTNVSVLQCLNVSRSLYTGINLFQIHRNSKLLMQLVSQIIKSDPSNYYITCGHSHTLFYITLEKDSSFSVVLTN